MEFFRIKRDIPFMRHALVFNVISALTFAAAVFFLVAKGLHLSIEFTGGTVMEVAYTKPADLEVIRKTVTGLGYADSQVQSFGTAQDVLIRLPLQGGASSAQVSTKTLYLTICIAQSGNGFANRFEVGRFGISHLHHRATSELDRQMQALRYQKKYRRCKCQR